MSGCCGGDAISGGQANGGDSPTPCCGFHAVITSGDNEAVGGADTIVPAGTEVFDEGGFYDSATFTWTPPQGLVSFGAAVAMASLGGGRFIRAVIFKNGSEFKRGSQVPESASSQRRSVISFIDLASGTDTYQLFIFLSAGANINMENSSLGTYFSGACVGVQCEAAS